MKRVLFSAALLSACGGKARLAVADGMGASPQLPPPNTSLIPVVAVAEGTGWPADEQPIAADGMAVSAFATGLTHPRWVYVLPNGDVLVAETNAPPSNASGIRAWFKKRMKKKAGNGVPSPNRIRLLRDANNDGRAELQTTLLDSLYSPFGMALVDSTLFVANADAILRVRYRAGDTVISSARDTLASLPGGPLNSHWTKSLIASADGRFLYAGVGSNSNAAENGLEMEEGRAAIWQIEIATGTKRIYASGLRNPVGLAWEPVSRKLWTAVNERDELGSDLVPDYLTSVVDGGFYGWPYSYFGSHVDARVKPQRPDLVATALVPDYALGPHTASLGLAWASGGRQQVMPDSGMFVGQHGSWNRRPPSGYKVVFVPFSAGRPAGLPIDVLTGFLTDDGKARGRPVGVAIDKAGALLVADDVGNTLWRVTRKRP